MTLVNKFNDYFKASKGNAFALDMCAAFSYGSNSFCFDQVEQLQKAANDGPSAAAPKLSTL